jgi:hypothetical protein
MANPGTAALANNWRAGNRLECSMGTMHDMSVDEHDGIQLRSMYSFVGIAAQLLYHHASDLTRTSLRLPVLVSNHPTLVLSSVLILGNGWDDCVAARRKDNERSDSYPC